MSPRILTFQRRVFDWCRRAFGEERTVDPGMRGLRLLEEALELAQAVGVGQRQAQEVLAYVYNRKPGEPRQEVGGTMVTLAALCQVFGIDMREAAEDELLRCESLTDVIRERNMAKPVFDGAPKPGVLEYSYDSMTDTFTVEGVRWSGLMLRKIAHDDLDRWIKIVQRTDGVVTVYLAPPGARLAWEGMRQGEDDSKAAT